jgi:hypothetical protein
MGPGLNARAVIGEEKLELRNFERHFEGLKGITVFVLLAEQLHDGNIGKIPLL